MVSAIAGAEQDIPDKLKHQLAKPEHALDKGVRHDRYWIYEQPDS